MPIVFKSTDHNLLLRLSKRYRHYNDERYEYARWCRQYIKPSIMVTLIASLVVIIIFSIKSMPLFEGELWWYPVIGVTAYKALPLAYLTSNILSPAFAFLGIRNLKESASWKINRLLGVFVISLYDTFRFAIICGIVYLQIFFVMAEYSLIFHL